MLVTIQLIYIPRIMRFWGIFISAFVIGKKLIFAWQLVDKMPSSHKHVGCS